MQCKYAKQNRSRCNREALPDSEKGYCLLHEDWEHKNEEETKKEFYKEIEEGITDFEGCILPKIDLSKKTIEGSIQFARATIEGGISFDGATIEGSLGYVSFDEATIEGPASFDGATIEGSPTFRGTTINGCASFKGATINGYTTFEGATINGCVSFGRATINAYVWFEGATIEGPVWFDGATIRLWASFDGATIKGPVSFDGATIGPTSFDGATIKLRASFEGATIEGPASFKGATIGYVSFDEATIKGPASFDRATIKLKASFDRATIEGPTSFDGATIKRDVSLFFANITLLTFKDATFDNLEVQEVACREAKITQERRGNRELANYHFYREMEAKRKRKYLKISFSLKPILKLMRKLRLEKAFNKHIGFLEKERRIYWGFLELPVQYIFGYGVYPWRVIVTWLVTVFVLAFVYWLGNGVEAADSLGEYIYFSVVTAATPGYGGYRPNPGFYQGLASFEAIFGTFMWAAFIATFARKYMR